ncbi:MAG: hypothetical protein HY727_15440 [Candidatus Rokubacteria bacterium]|nr:hypothetical protein [Candidatus Rokubacteria bacterium]
MSFMMVFAALVLAIGLPASAMAHHVGVYIPKDNDISKNFKDIKFAGQSGRFDLALKLFDDGIVHATMERREKELPRNLEDGLRAAIKAGDLQGVELRLGIFLAFMTKERVADALERLQNGALSPERRRDQARKFLNAAWRYYNLADFVVTAQDPKTAVALRMGFEDAYTYLGSMMVDPMWAGGSSRPPVPADDRRASAALARMLEASTTFIGNGAKLAAAGRAKLFLPAR